MTRIIPLAIAIALLAGLAPAALGAPAQVDHTMIVEPIAGQETDPCTGELIPTAGEIRWLFHLVQTDRALILTGSSLARTEGITGGGDRVLFADNRRSIQVDTAAGTLVESLVTGQRRIVQGAAADYSSADRFHIVVTPAGAGQARSSFASGCRP